MLLRKSVLIRLLVFGGLVAIAAGCQRTDNSAGETPGRELVKKLNIYISQCANRHSVKVLDNYTTYSSWIANIKKGPTGKENPPRGLDNKIGEVAFCGKHIEMAKAMKPSLPDLEAVAEKYYESLQEIAAQINGVYDYYHENEFLKDDFQRGKAAHPALLKAFKKFEAVNGEFAALLENYRDQAVLKDLELFKNDPERAFEYAVTDCGVKRSKIINALPAVDERKANPESMRLMVDEFEKCNSELYSKYSRGILTMKHFDAAHDFIEELRALLIRIEKKRPLTEEEKKNSRYAGWPIEGTPSRITFLYNQMVENPLLAK